MARPKIRFEGFDGDWEQRKVGEFYDFKNGLNKGKEYFGSGTPIVNFTDVFHNRGICSEELQGRVNLEPSEIKKFEVKKGDVFFTRTSETIDEIGYPSVMLDDVENTVFSGFVLRGRSVTDEDPLDNLFKKYVFFTDAFRNEMTSKSSMTTRALTSGTAIKTMKFLFPKSKQEQHKIGECITELENLITLHQRKCEETKTLKKYMLQKMFPQDGQSVPEIRFEEFTGDWERRKVSEVAEICAGGTPSTKIEKYWYPKEIPWLSSGEVHKKYITYTDNKISVEGMKNSSARMIPENSVLIALAGQGKTRGTVAINRIPLTTNQSIAAMIFSEEIIPEFVFCNLENRYEELRRMSSGDGSRGGLNKQIVGEIEIPYTSREEQQKIGAFFSNLDHLITLHQRKHDELTTLKKYMLQNMFV